MTLIKTTIELPDELFRAAKATALRRRTTLKELFTHALRREISGAPLREESVFRVDEDGVPYLPSRNVSVTRSIVEEIEDVEDR